MKTGGTRAVIVRRVILSLLVVGAIALIGIGFSLTKEPDPEVQLTDSALVQVFPSGGSLDLRQAEIGFILQPAYTGRLLVDGVAIPDDQIAFQVGVNRWSFTPGPGTETGALHPGRHTATAIFWQKGKDEPSGRRDSWSFNAH
jgi:hypothetical protein